MQRAAGAGGTEGGFITYALGAAAAYAPVRYRKRLVCDTLLLYRFNCRHPPAPGDGVRRQRGARGSCPTVVLGSARRGAHQLCRGSLSPRFCDLRLAGTALVSLPWCSLQALSGLVASSAAADAYGFGRAPLSSFTPNFAFLL